MKLLWVKADFLHPTTRGGEIRTLETLKRLHSRHEIHYVALRQLDHGNAEGIERSSEYCTRAYAIPHQVPDKSSLGFAVQLARGLVSPMPVAVSRYRSRGMQQKIEELVREQVFDCIVCDFLFPAQNIPKLSSCVLFQHNVEAVIWKRRAENARNPIERFYLQQQARRMYKYERETCREVKRIIAVSGTDAAVMREEYGAQQVRTTPTGVDLEYFCAPTAAPRTTDLVFVGSMDWAPNIEGAEWFVREVLPLIRKQKPDCSVSFAGRKPARSILDLAAADPLVVVTRTVPDIRPHLWGATVSIVPLLTGGGTRLKIFEAMAARIPVVSTTIGAEGLPVEHGEHLYLADDPQSFAARCLELMETPEMHSRLACAGWRLVSSRFSWDAAAQEFERLLLC
jgi:glycosyltransferase involved in cell wall biosynthesis